MFQGLANRNDANLMVSLRVHDGYDNIFEKSESNVPRLAVVLTSILDHDQRTIEDCFGITKVNAVFGEIELALLFIPRNTLAL